MDKMICGKERPEEVTRESLIAISYAEPDKVLASELSPEDLNGEKLVEGEDPDGTDKYRSELISISYPKSPDIEGSPVTKEEDHF
ncbi:hypothetical protein SLE2022_106600 [Rubroshorea leprosula]